MNFKGKLNELYPQDPPQYETKVAGDPHNPRFSSRITHHGVILAVSDQASSKKAAEQQAAKIALERLTGGKAALSRTPPARVTRVLMIDGENLQKLVHEIPRQENTQVFVYFSKNHHLARVNVPEYATRVISPCTRTDGCDIFLDEAATGKGSRPARTRSGSGKAGTGTGERTPDCRSREGS